MRILVVIVALFLTSPCLAEVISSLDCPMARAPINCEVVSFHVDKPVFSFDQYDGGVLAKFDFRYLCIDGNSYELEFAACFHVPQQLQYDAGTGNLLSGEQVILRNEDGVLRAQVRSEVWISPIEDYLPEVKLFK